MSKKITLLGSTGSIGTQSLDVIRAQGYEVFGLSAHSHVEKILEQIEEFHPRYVCMTDPDAAARLDAALAGRANAPRLLTGPEGLKELAAMDGPDVVLNSVVGIAGLGASLTAIESGHDLALANKIEAFYKKPEDIDYINAHGTATHHNDLFETKAIKLALRDHAYKVKINSTKSMVGHLLGAAGAVEFIVCVKSILDGFIHQTVGTTETEEELDLNYMIGAPAEQEVRYAMSNSLGFGGHNGTLLVKKYEEE